MTLQLRTRRKKKGIKRIKHVELKTVDEEVSLLWYPFVAEEEKNIYLSKLISFFSLITREPQPSFSPQVSKEKNLDNISTFRPWACQQQIICNNNIIKLVQSQVPKVNHLTGRHLLNKIPVGPLEQHFSKCKPIHAIIMSATKWKFLCNMTPLESSNYQVKTQWSW